MESKLTFANGCKMPVLGLGTWTATDEKELEIALDAALEAGYRHIDTATMYGNEAQIGKVLKKWIDSGKIRREELFIVTKLPPNGMTKEKAVYFFNKSLKALQLDYIDLYLLHTPYGLQYVDDASIFPMKDGSVLLDVNSSFEEVYKELEKLVDEGKVKSLGVSNFNVEQLKRVYNIAKHKPMNNQVELNVYLQQKELREECRKLGVTICGFAPIGSPGRADLLIPAAKQSNWQRQYLLADPVVVKIAEARKKTPAQILLRYLTQLEGVAVISKSSNPERIKQNADIFDIKLTSEEMGQLQKLDRGEEGRTFLADAVPGIKAHPEYPYIYHKNK